MMRPAFVIKTHARSRRIRITIKADGECVVTVPRGCPKGIVDRFVAEKTEWIEKKQEEMRGRGVGGVQNFPPYSLACRDEALKFVQERIVTLNEGYGFVWKNVTVRNQKTRWGSCSRRGNISFNYRIVYLPERLADYIIVHELCHLKEMNHSPRFWALVAQTFPEYRTLRKNLYAHALIT